MDAAVSHDARRWWREVEVALLIVVVLGIYFSRLTTLPIRGEETRRAMVAREILWSGDWIIPRQQGEPFLSRPPLGSYPIVLASLVAGDTTLLATRLPTAIATLLTALLIYGYCRQRMSSTGALASAIAYSTAGQVLQFGQIAETEATFTLLVAGSLLLWHWGYLAGWSKYSMWISAYICVALGALAKGPQAPVYFAATVGLFMLVRREWRGLFHPAHFAGIGVFAAIMGAWQIPFAMQLGWPAVKDVWGGDVGLRFVEQTWLTLAEHIATFPAEVWMYLLPSSVLLLAYLHPSFWKKLHADAPWIAFAVIAVLVTFPTCWFIPGAKPRYFMPLYPCLAVMMGVVVEHSRHSLRESSAFFRVWRTYQWTHLGAAVGVSAAAIALAWWPSLPNPWLRVSPSLAVVVAIVCCLAAIALTRGMRAFDERSIRTTLVAAAAITGVAYTGLILQVSAQRSENVAAQVAAVKERMPEGATLFSFGLQETMFTYHYAEPVVLLSDKQTTDVPKELEYFCVSVNDQMGSLRLPFAWRQEAAISCDRWKREQPQRWVIVGRRLNEAVARDAR